ncbi:P2X purinoceptor 3a [Oncorhynchus tshawytscha]|uniref:P2X purinoceptor 3a n=1 Tax=Oncorhynchus tshawytscha TaxID=74940 RepID=UPI001C3CF70E|nr:P2X purinoceptor 3a [Oncorhynchus tshawytscha]
MPKIWAFITDFFTYETTKSVVVKSRSVGIINRVVQLLIIIYFLCWVFYHEKAYQVRDSGIESSVMTKVKGFGYHNNRVMDVADYVAPTQGAAVFCIITKLIITENQFQGFCPESESKYKCDTDEECDKYLGSSTGNGIITGACVNSSKGRRCEMEGWCLAEDDKVHMQPMMEVENFTIFIKNSIRFPMFNVTRGNFPSSLNATYIRSCTYDPEHNLHCPIFKVGEVLRYTGQNFSTIAQTGGEIAINIEWQCNLDESEERCEPHYSFMRLDAVFQKNGITKGYNFRFAKYYKNENGTEFRTLHKAYAIRFDILVTGLAGKFNTVPTLINVVAAFTSVGLGTVLCDIILLNFLKGADQYKAKKFEEVSESQIQILLSREGCSQLSIQPEEKVSDDSGTVSLCLDQQL